LINGNFKKSLLFPLLLHSTRATVFPRAFENRRLERMEYVEKELPYTLQVAPRRIKIN
jgi:hypothetical protein